MTPGFLKTAPVPHLRFESVRIAPRGNHSGYTSDRQRLYLLVLKVIQAEREHRIPPAGTKGFPGDGTGENKHAVRMPSGRGKWFEFYGGLAPAFLLGLCRNYLKAPSAHMWGWPISLSDWVNTEKRNVAQHQSPGGQNRSQLVPLTEAFIPQQNKS